MKPIRLKKSQYLDEGTYAEVYRISPRRVVKVFHDYKYLDNDHLIQDEMAGVSQFKNGLPVLGIVKVLKPGQKKPKKALLKRYIPHEADYDDLARNGIKEGPKEWDVHALNYRKDSYGNLWRIDTQTSKVTDY